MEKGTTILFGLPGVAVERVERVSHDGGPIRLVRLTTVAWSAAAYPACGVISRSVHCKRTIISQPMRG